jgi:hypothetical protein
MVDTCARLQTLLNAGSCVSAISGTLSHLNKVLSINDGSILNSPDHQARAVQLVDACDKFRQQVSRIVVGQDEVVEQLLTALQWLALFRLPCFGCPVSVALFRLDGRQHRLRHHDVNSSRFASRTQPLRHTGRPRICVQRRGCFRVVLTLAGQRQVRIGDFA